MKCINKSLINKKKNIWNNFSTDFYCEWLINDVIWNK